MMLYFILNCIFSTYSDITWWDFNNSTFVSLFVVFLAVILILALLITTFVILNTREQKYFSKVKEESNALRIYCIDVKNNYVSYFKRSDISNKMSMTFDDFYNLFHENDMHKVKNWVLSILSNDVDVSPYLEVDVISKSGHKPLFALLRLVAFNPENAVIYIEMQVLKFLTPKNDDKKHRKLNQGSGLTTLGALKDIVDHYKSTKGYTFSIRFTYVNQLAFSETEEERLMVLKIKDKIYPFISSKDKFRYLVEINDHELLMSDLKIDSRNKAYQLAMSISSVVHKEMLLNGYEKYIKLSIGIIENRLFYKSFDDILKHAQETSFITSQEGTNNHISFYEKTFNLELAEDKNKDVIDSLIKENKMKYLFRPIVNVKEKKVLGYTLSVKTYGNAFTSYNEMIRYAHSCNKASELFASVAKSVIPRFADQAPKSKTPLFYPVSILDFANIEKILPQIIRIEKIKLVLVFDEHEISQNASHIKELTNTLSTLKILGYDLCLMLMDKNLLLDVSFYKIFDYFIAGTSMTGELKRNSNIQIALRTLIESLLKYKKPIIATGLEGMTSVELMVKSGVNYVSSEAISPSNEMVLPVASKKLDKLAEFI